MITVFQMTKPSWAPKTIVFSSWADTKFTVLELFDYFDAIRKWCVSEFGRGTVIEGHYNWCASYTSAGFYFAFNDPNMAMRFKLRWCGV